MAGLPELSFHRTTQGVKSHQDRTLDDGRFFHRVTEAVMPNVRIVASPFVEFEGKATSVAWTLPISRTETKIFTILKRPIGQERRRALYNGQIWPDLSEEEHQRYPGDYEAQVGQGAITIHSEENLASSDRGVSIFRHVFRQQVRAVNNGELPVGVTNGVECRYEVRAGNYIGKRDDVIHLG
jgi:hypothetical protein